MRVVIQRVKMAEVVIDGNEKRSIKGGLLVLCGFEDADTDEDLDWIAGKISRLRIFNDEAGIMNKSVEEINGQIMLISQFTLFASTKKGNRPSYSYAAKPENAMPLYQRFIDIMQNYVNKDIVTGKFGADMQITLVNDGPVTIIIDSKKKE
ncbi:MAG TPA: D-aminoacyl-tRNA deacylase [Bacteroidales bacterium]|nr:D-aminoacyl-tRNA deacylase [Bacteroidales bacterium]